VLVLELELAPVAPLTAVSRLPTADPETAGAWPTRSDATLVTGETTEVTVPIGSGSSCAAAVLAKAPQKARIAEHVIPIAAALT
jgi:hypothetical protein